MFLHCASHTPATGGSHCSVPSVLLSPQTMFLQVALQVAVFGGSQSSPGWMNVSPQPATRVWHAAVHVAVFGGSHCSPVSLMLLPQTADVVTFTSPESVVTQPLPSETLTVRVCVPGAEALNCVVATAAFTNEPPVPIEVHAYVSVAPMSGSEAAALTLILPPTSSWSGETMRDVMTGQLLNVPLMMPLPRAVGAPQVRGTVTPTVVPAATLKVVLPLQELPPLPSADIVTL